MDQIWTSFDRVVGALLEQLFTIDRWPLFSAMLVFTIIGQWSSKKLFTRHRAYHEKPQWFWYWGRESLPVHPIAAGFVLAVFWRNPEGVEWGYTPTAFYFATAGVGSLICWVVIKAILKKRGIHVELPGISEPPEPLEQ